VNKPLLEIKNLTQRFALTKGIWQELHLEGGRIVRRPRHVHAVNDVSFTVGRGEVFSIVGESGCGKSTTARTIIKLIEPRSGQIVYDGEDITAYNARQMLPFRRRMQMVFQNPYASLNPRHTIRRILTEPMLFHQLAADRREADEKAMLLLDRVGLRQEQADRFPHQFSGGQRQRISIARALALSPEFVIADEPVSALDVSIQAQILNLMMDLREEFNLSYLFIAHDLAVVKHISDRIAVMYLGQIVEMGAKQDLFAHPLHPYTQGLFASVPKLGGKSLHEASLSGDVPTTPTALPTGCYFHARCPNARPLCSEQAPVMRDAGGGHYVTCHMTEG
jgi:oligopeptide/dipeptide ABC transporter ATP-binding protein